MTEMNVCIGGCGKSGPPAPDYPENVAYECLECRGARRARTNQLKRDGIDGITAMRTSEREQARAARPESLIMCDRCGLGYPGREIANLGSLERPEWVCADCFRTWVDSIQFGDGFGTATQPPLPRLKNAPTEVLMPGFDPDDYPLNQPSGSDAQVRSWQGIERTDHPTMPLIGGDDRVAVMDDQDGLLLAVHVIVANVMALLALAYGARAAWRWAR